VTDINQPEALTQAHIDIIRLEIRVAHLSASTASLEESNQKLTEKVDQVLLTLSEARGGRKTLMAGGGLITWVGRRLHVAQVDVAPDVGRKIA
jgi:hypothetical protein